MRWNRLHKFIISISPDHSHMAVFLLPHNGFRITYDQFGLAFGIQRIGRYREIFEFFDSQATAFCSFIQTLLDEALSNGVFDLGTQARELRDGLVALHNTESLHARKSNFLGDSTEHRNLTKNGGGK